MLIIRKFTKKYSDNQIFFVTFALIVVSGAYLLCAHNVKQNNYLHLASSSFVSPRAVLYLLLISESETSHRLIILNYLILHFEHNVTEE